MRFKMFIALMTAFCILFAASLSFGAAEGKTSGQPSAFLPSDKYEFSPVLEGNYVTHEFSIQNKGTGPLKIKKVTAG